MKGRRQRTELSKNPSSRWITHDPTLRKPVAQPGRPPKPSLVPASRPFLTIAAKLDTGEPIGAASEATQPPIAPRLSQLKQFRLTITPYSELPELAGRSPSRDHSARRNPSSCTSPFLSILSPSTSYPNLFASSWVTAELIERGGELRGNKSKNVERLQSSQPK